MKNRNCINLAGDGRCDSPGYNAKYGTYSFIDPETNKVIDFVLINVSQASSSVVMEKMGFVELLERIENFGLNIRSITTDRHIQIRAYLSKNRKDIIHQFDIWHVSKSVKKKLVKKAKGCDALNNWIKSVINHFWWCCSTCSGDAKLLKEKWLSLLNHVKNKHSWKNNNDFTLFKKCAHKKLSITSRTDIEWLVEGSPTYYALEQVVLDKSLLKDFAQLVEFRHTGQLEVYHSLINKYCPKRQHFHMVGMYARQQLAVMDHNSGTHLSQAKNKKGEDIYKFQYSKIMKQWVAKPLKEQKNHQHLKDMVDKVVQMKKENLPIFLPTFPELLPNIAKTLYPEKSELQEQHCSRFK